MIVAAVAVLATRAKRQVKEKQQGNLLKTVQKIFKFYAHVQEIHRPDRQKQQSRSVQQLTNNVHLASSARLICAFWIEGVQQLILYLSHADTFILHSSPTSNSQSGKVRAR